VEVENTEFDVADRQAMVWRSMRRCLNTEIRFKEAVFYSIINGHPPLTQWPNTLGTLPTSLQSEWALSPSGCDMRYTHTYEYKERGCHF